MEMNLFVYFILVFLASFFCTLPFTLYILVPKNGIGTAIRYLLIVIGIFFVSSWIYKIYEIWGSIMVDFLHTMWSFAVVYGLIAGGVTTYVVWLLLRKKIKRGVSALI